MAQIDSYWREARPLRHGDDGEAVARCARAGLVAVPTEKTVYAGRRVRTERAAVAEILRQGARDFNPLIVMFRPAAPASLGNLITTSRCVSPRRSGPAITLVVPKSRTLSGRRSG